MCIECCIKNNYFDSINRHILLSVEVEFINAESPRDRLGLDGRRKAKIRYFKVRRGQLGLLVVGKFHANFGISCRRSARNAETWGQAKGKLQKCGDRDNRNGQSNKTLSWRWL